MNQPDQYSIVAIPLNREGIISFLSSIPKRPKGAKVRVLNQRPTVASEIEWVEKMKEEPSVENLMWRDRPDNHLAETTTDRLIPVEYLREDEGYLTRNLGGWSPVYFGLIGANPDDFKTDPMLKEAVVLTRYGNQIKWFGTNKSLVISRLETEFGTEDAESVCRAILRLHDWRKRQQFARSAVDMMAYADSLYLELSHEGALSKPSEDGPAVPQPLLLDELTGQMVRIELARRDFVVSGNMEASDKISAWQNNLRAKHGLHLILKGEYVMGRQRRSTVLIAADLGMVVKQPGVEPFHEADMGAVTHNDNPENWPVLTRNGEVVTPGGRLKLVIEQGIIVKLSRVFGHPIKCISALGFIIEPYISGPTLQEYLLEDPSRLTQKMYDYILLHQLVCEELGVENGDWHSANFIVLESETSPSIDVVPKMVHIDWGAARPLEKHEYTSEMRDARLNQVKNIGFSFHHEKLAAEFESLHQQTVVNQERLHELRVLARNISSEN